MGQKSIRKLSAIGPGKTYYFTVPREMIKTLKWKRGEKKVVSIEDNRIIIEDWKG